MKKLLKHARDTRRNTVFPNGGTGRGFTLIEVLIVLVIFALVLAPSAMAATMTPNQASDGIYGFDAPNGADATALANFYDALAGKDFSRARAALTLGGGGSTVLTEVLAPNINQYLGGYDMTTVAAIAEIAGGNLYLNDTTIFTDAGLLGLTGKALMTQYMDTFQGGHLTGGAAGFNGLATVFSDEIGPGTSGGFLVLTEPALLNGGTYIYLINGLGPGARNGLLLGTFNDNHADAAGLIHPG